MGFGSYDESEQENQEIDTDEIDESETREKADNKGEVNFEFEDADTDDLVAQLNEMRDDD